MIHLVEISEAETQLEKLLDWVLAGEEIVITCSGKPTARLIPMDLQKQPRQPGIDAGKVIIADDFDAPFPEFE